MFQKLAIYLWSPTALCIIDILYREIGVNERSWMQKQLYKFFSKKSKMVFKI